MESIREYISEEKDTNVNTTQKNLMNEINKVTNNSNYLNLVVFNSKSSGCHREIPQDTLKVVNELFDDTNENDKGEHFSLFGKQFGSKEEEDDNMVLGKKELHVFPKTILASGDENEEYTLFGPSPEKNPEESSQVPGALPLSMIIPNEIQESLVQKNITSQKNDWGNAHTPTKVQKDGIIFPDSGRIASSAGIDPKSSPRPKLYINYNIGEPYRTPTVDVPNSQPSKSESKGNQKKSIIPNPEDETEQLKYTSLSTGLKISPRISSRNNMSFSTCMKSKMNISLLGKLDEPYGKQKDEIKDTIISKKNKTKAGKRFSSLKISNADYCQNKTFACFLPIEKEILDSQISSIFEEVLLYPSSVENMRSLLDGIPLSVNCPIGELNCNGLSSYAFMSGISQRDMGLQEIGRFAPSFRVILSDGDSFYRSFLFSVLENIILRNHLFELEKIIFGIYSRVDNNFSRKNIKVNKSELMSIMFLIHSFLKKNQINEAYAIFIRAYHLNSNFDNGLIKFMRIALSEFIDLNHEKIFLFPELISMIPSAYISHNSFNFTTFNEDCILLMQYEAPDIVIALSSIVFTVTLELHVLEGTEFFDRKDTSYLKIVFPCLAQQISLGVVSLLYRFAHFDKLYAYTILNEYGSIIQGLLSNINPRLLIHSNETNCEACMRKSEVVSFAHIPDEVLCKLCLNDLVKKIMSSRVKSFSSEGYNNAEYYCRPIILDANKNIIISDEDAVLFMDKTLSQQLVFLIDNICQMCNSQFRSDNMMVSMPCNCKLCFNCVQEKIKIDTDGRIVQNNFEKKYSKTKPSICACGLPFDVESAVKMTITDIYHFESESASRLIKYTERFCSLCKKDVSKYASNLTLVQKGENVIRFPIIPDTSDPTSANVPHLLCKDCILPLKADIVSKIKSGQLPTNTKVATFKCTICLKIHTVEMKILKPLLRSEDRGCCFAL